MSKKSSPREIELLAPAKDAEVAIAAINCGADAVYMGANKFGARSAAGNSIADLKRVADYAHKFNARLYATVNTILYDSELKDVERLIGDLYRIGVDALIVQDMSILRMDIPPIALHSSTQCDLRTPEKARFLSEVGFSQLVMARELTLSEIQAIHNATDAKLEAFVYGALCVSYSGRCQISEAMLGRSANRGECAQVCRMNFDLIDEFGKPIVKNRHLLSLRDLNQSDRLVEMIQAGVSSFKIEGRLKDASYVKNAVAYFRNKIDKIIATNSELYCRSSNGTSSSNFNPALEKCFNRTYTHYFLDTRNPKNGYEMASTLTPKSQGEYIGKLKYKNNRQLAIDTKTPLNNGDGLSFYDGKEFTGFRVNRVEKGRISILSDVYIPDRAAIYRTYNKMHDDEIRRAVNERKIAVNMVLRQTDNCLALDAIDERGNQVTASIDLAESLSESKTSQVQRQVETLGKLGNTIYKQNSCEILTSAFIPLSMLAELRRKTIELLDEAQIINYRSELRRHENITFPYVSEQLLSADNVANQLSKQFYEQHGVKHFEYAIEVNKRSAQEPQPLMHTRYCIRRELGACRKSSNAKNIPEKIYLRTGKTTLRVECNCSRCEMKIYMND